MAIQDCINQALFSFDDCDFDLSGDPSGRRSCYRGCSRQLRESIRHQRKGLRSLIGRVLGAAQLLENELAAEEPSHTHLIESLAKLTNATIALGDFTAVDERTLAALEERLTQLDEMGDFDDREFRNNRLFQEQPPFEGH